MYFSDKPLEPFGEILVDLSIPTQLSFKMPLVFRVTRELTTRGYLPGGTHPQVEMVLDEAITNCMVHGNRLDAARTIRMRLFVDEERWGVLLEDEGDGFTAEDLPDPEDPESLFQESGRGILLMDAYLDELIYGPGGTSVLLIQQHQPAEPVAEAEAEPMPVAEKSAPREPIQVQLVGAVSLVRLGEARITDENLGSIRETLIAEAEVRPGLVIDMARVEYISSAFIGTLMAAYRELRGRGGRMILGAIQPSLAEILKSVSLDRVLELVPDPDEAAAELARELGDPA